MSTLRVSNIEAKAFPSSPTVDEKVKVTNSSGDILLHLDGTTSGIGTVGIGTTGTTFRVDPNQTVTFPGNVTSSGIVTATKLVGPLTGNVTGNLSGDILGTRNLGTGVTVTSAGIVSATKFFGDITGDGSNISNLPAANIVGTIPSASLTSVDADLASIRKDIALLSLQTAVDTNRVSFNLQNSFVDQFENNAGIADSTSVAWDSSGEFLSARAVTAASPVIYNYTGGDVDYTPAGSVSYMIVHMWGAAGGAGCNYSSGGGAGRIAFTGGAGGYSTGKITPSGSPTYKVSVGQGGSCNDPVNGGTASAYNNGGRGYVFTHAGAGGGGGGYTGIFLTSKSHGNSVMIAGGGAGSIGINAGGGENFAGSGGGTNGQDGGVNTSHGGASTYGKKGTQSAGGATADGDYGSRSGGSALSAGNGGHMCGGGGSGYYGGSGGGHKNSNGSAGSAGGSGYIGHSHVSEATTSITLATDENAAYIDPPGTDVSGYANNAGRGVDAADGKHGQVIITAWTDAISATGICTSIRNTPTSARTKVSGVMLYKDAAGTATLGTDLKVFFTCNGGTNWTEVVGGDMSTGSDFSTGVKTVYLAEKTCTSGTDVRYKLEFYNQSGSKTTQVHGMALNY